MISFNGSTPADTMRADFVPATVTYSRDGRTAVVTHPAGPSHENALQPVARLRARGVRVVQTVTP